MKAYCVRGKIWPIYKCFRVKFKDGKTWYMKVINTITWNLKLNGNKRKGFDLLKTYKCNLKLVEHFYVLWYEMKVCVFSCALWPLDIDKDQKLFHNAKGHNSLYRCNWIINLTLSNLCSNFFWGIKDWIFF
jgi:hypothetical protein